MSNAAPLKPVAIDPEQHRLAVEAALKNRTSHFVIRKPGPLGRAALKRFVLELLDLASTTPKLDVVAINQTAGVFFRGLVIWAF
jgi:hypothetical protein